MPFAEYDDFDDCVSQNQDKDDPEAYCAAIQREAEGKSVFGYLKSAIQAVKDLFTPNDRVFRIYKDAEGNLRWLGIVTNQWRDHDNPPEIIEAKAHEECVQWMDKAGQYPPLRLWHTKGTDFGTTDMAEFTHGFVVVSGKITNEGVARALKGMNLGMSHGFTYKYSDPDNRIIGWYRPFEVSVLPVEYAANPWTTVEMMEKETTMRPEKRAFLEKTLGADATEKLLANLGEMQKTLSTAGVEWKDIEPTPPEPTPPPPAPVAEDYKELLDTVKALPQELAEVREAVKALEALTDRIAAVEAAAKANADEIKKTHDEIVAEAVRPRSSGYQPTKDPANIVPEGDALKAAKPAIDENFAKSLV